mmetsp:Transcript_675/g.796  ORF Transcript_675/g.796 Transcript_675/m.796 type:complete len:108 (-) Transcript_675:37-360(-)
MDRGGYGRFERRGNNSRWNSAASSRPSNGTESLFLVEKTSIMSFFVGMFIRQNNSFLFFFRSLPPIRIMKLGMEMELHPKIGNDGAGNQISIVESYIMIGNDGAGMK